MISRRGELTSRAPPPLSAWVPFPDWAQEAGAQGKHRGPAELKSKQRVCSSQSGWNLQGKAPEEKELQNGGVDGLPRVLDRALGCTSGEGR